MHAQACTKADDIERKPAARLEEERRGGQELSSFISVLPRALESLSRVSTREESFVRWCHGRRHWLVKNQATLKLTLYECQNFHIWVLGGSRLKRSLCLFHKGTKKLTCSPKAAQKVLTSPTFSGRTITGPPNKISGLTSHYCHS